MEFPKRHTGRVCVKLEYQANPSVSLADKGRRMLRSAEPRISFEPHHQARLFSLAASLHRTEMDVKVSQKAHIGDGHEDTPI
jgi:hypothetical protein